MRASKLFRISLAVLTLAWPDMIVAPAYTAPASIEIAKTPLAAPTDVSSIRRGGAAFRRTTVARGPRGGTAFRRTTAVRGPRGGVAVRRTTAVSRPGYRGGGVRRAAVVRPGWRGGGVRWARPGNYWWRPGGAIAAGAAIGFVTAATAVAWAGAAPAPNMCWYYTDASRTQGFWDACP
jgi:hypothetical protein